MSAIVWEDGTQWVHIADVHEMEPFLSSVVSPFDHWLYASSSGGLTGGRVNAETSLFPYRTDDLLHQAHGQLGGWTRLTVEHNGELVHWHPLVHRPTPGITRHLRKSTAGDQLMYIEEHASLGMVIKVRWAFSKAFGLVRTVTLSAETPRKVQVIDGLVGVLPASVPLGLVQTSSCLVDAYSRSQWLPDAAMAVYSLESLPTDKAEPCESLHANVVWQTGLDLTSVLLSEQQLNRLALGHAPQPEHLCTGRSGAFLGLASIDVGPASPATWHVVADVKRTQAQVAALAGADRSADALKAELRLTTATLDGILADVDGLQRTADPVLDAHQRASALFNAMRGGVPIHEYRIDPNEFRRFVARRNRAAAERNADWLHELGDTPLSARVLRDRADACKDRDMMRLSRSFLPLWFGRRHGDPSRPWNRFSIQVRGDNGGRRVAWEGNWRDVFQNWEALLLAYPEFIDNVVSVFLDATTLDGNNPYRITSEGIDWEVPEPENPWSNLGYWGDHQVNYLTRLLELSMAHQPSALSSSLAVTRFSFADVPYRIRPYSDRVRDARDSVAFDETAHRQAMARQATLGADGRLVPDGDGILHVSLAEKLLIPVLAKVCSLVPGAGIWLDTQRPEWNDANNALAGPGISVVTTAYLRRHIDTLETLFADGPDSVPILQTTQRWLTGVMQVLSDTPPSEWTPVSRRAVMDALGDVGDAARARAYGATTFDRGTLSTSDLIAFCQRARVWFDDALRYARRDDGLMDGYDLVRFDSDGAHVRRLYPMLEGQVAVLSSGALTPDEAVALLTQLFDSDLYRADVNTFMLYPRRDLPNFLAKNQVAGDREVPELLERDVSGTLRFDASLSNEADLRDAMAEHSVSDDAREYLLDAWEQTFDHQAFTGRSGTMHAYEGIGSVYWHMVGKLLLAAVENANWARSAGEDDAADALELLAERVRDGLGYRRSAQEFGAFMTDPYSHTPWGRGAQQPGMTGLVKEELVARRLAIGVHVEQGCLVFAPDSLDPQELLTGATDWHIPAGVRPGQTIPLPAGSIGLQICGVPVVIEDAETSSITVHAECEHHVDGTTLPETWSARVFARDAALSRLHIRVPIRS